MTDYKVIDVLWAAIGGLLVGVALTRMYAGGTDWTIGFQFAMGVTSVGLASVSRVTWMRWTTALARAWLRKEKGL